MEILKIIQSRFSPRAFSDKMVGDEQLQVLFEAARLAPSARNEQPWRFFYATKENEESYHEYFSILNDWNQKWAQSAPVLIAAVAKMNYDHKNIPNVHALYDLGQAVAYLSMQATELGLYVHQMGGFYPDKAKKILNLPEGYEATAMLVLGYKGDLDRIPEEYRSSDVGNRVRIPIEKLVYHGNEKMI